jgi:ribosomal protein S4
MQPFPADQFPALFNCTDARQLGHRQRQEIEEKEHRNQLQEAQKLQGFVAIKGPYSVHTFGKKHRAPGAHAAAERS